MPLLAADNLIAGYGPVDILHGVSLRVEPGEFVTIIGPNGSGKSTLLKALFGLVSLRSGTVTFDGQDIAGGPPERLPRRGLGYVPQAANVFAALTVAENLEMGAFIRKTGIAGRIKEMYELFPDLAEHRRRRAGNLSGGQRQMLALARALMLDPKLLLLDEPSAGLSPALMETVFGQIKRIQEQGVAAVIVEQNAREALGISQRAYVLADGSNRLENTAAELLHDPEVVRLYLGG